MISLFRRISAGIFLLLASTGIPAAAQTILFSETFNGLSSDSFNGRTPAVNLLSPGGVWTADTIFAANGQVNDGTNTDRGAWLDLGQTFTFSANQTYKLSLSWTNLDNGILFAGFSTTAPNAGAQVQTQGTNFAVRARRIAAGSDTLASWKNPGAAAVTGTTVTATTGTATLTLTTNNLSNATFTVDGLASPIAVDLTAGYRYLWIGYEDPTAASPASDARLVSLTLNGPAPVAQPDPPVVTIAPATPLLFAGQIITLSSTPADAEIRYTVDGSVPGATSTLYSGPFPLNTSATVRAIGIKSSVTGSVSSRTYATRQPIGTPNLLFIIGEDIGYGDLQCYGGVNIATPTLDSLAYDGIRFTQFTTTGPGAPASQYALLTGRVPARSGMGASVVAGDSGLKSEEWTMAESLRRRGYDTAFIGEWLLGNASGSHPNDQGFRLFHGLPYELAANPPLVEDRQELETSPAQATLLDELTERATRFINESSQPFALVFQAPALPATGTSIGGPQGNRIEALDAAVARLLAALGSHGIANQTLVIFSSDGGAARDASGGSNSVLRDGKGTTWEGGMRGPLLARLPGTLPAGQLNLSPIWLPDLLPTLASLLGGDLATDRPLDGASRADALKGTRTHPTGDETAIGFRYESFAWKLATVRQGKWKSHLSIVNIDPLNTNPTTGSQLYDLQVDAEEYINRASQQAATVTQLQQFANSFSASLPAAGKADLPLPKAAVKDGISSHLEGGTGVTFSLTRPSDSLDDFYQIEHSQDLATWQKTPVSNFIISRIAGSNHDEALEVHVPFGVAPFDGERRFVRLTASRPADP
ncbi:MAG: sulfatase-like hydrolase/transferase [Luteolibacter sp.]